MNHQLKHLVIFGAQGSGKGTQAKRLEKEFGLVYIGLGDVLREMARENSPLGKRVDQTLKAGQLMPDALVSEIIELQLGSIPPGTGFILDGYPRTVVQATQAREIFGGLGRLVPPPIFVNLQVPRAEGKRRLEKRHKIEKRHDDIRPIIDKRLAIYDKETKPVLDAVKAWAQVIDVDGDQPIPKVTEEILTKLDDVAKK